MCGPSASRTSSAERIIAGTWRGIGPGTVNRNDLVAAASLFQEVCWLTKDDFWREGCILIMCFPTTKNGVARTVPIHDAIVEEGLLDDWRSARPGLLFTGDGRAPARFLDASGAFIATGHGVWVSSTRRRPVSAGRADT